MNLNKPARLCVDTTHFRQFSREKKASGAAEKQMLSFQAWMGLEAKITKGYSFSLVVHF